MKQKLQDLKLLLQSSRKAQVIAGLTVFSVLFLIFGPSGRKPQTRKIGNVPQAKTSSIIGSEEVAQDLTTRFQSDIRELQRKQTELISESEKTRKESQEFQERTLEVFRKVLEKISDQQTANGNPNEQLVAGQDVIPGDGQEAGDDLQPFGMSAQEVPVPPTPATKKIAFVGAGDSVRVKLLAGVNAATDGTPYPVVFKLIGDIHGPDGSTLPLGEAKLIAAAQGDLTAGRAFFRVTKLNIQLPNGERKVFPVDGWVVGEDGKMGMPGKLIDPIGNAIGASMVAGAIQGAGQGFSQRNVVNNRNPLGGFSTEVVGSIGEFAAGQGVSAGAREWSSIIRERLNQMVPVVEVYSGREGTAVFAESLEVTGLLEALQGAEEDAVRGLD